MGSFGINWNQKNPMVWDWEQLVPSVSNAVTRHGSANSSGGTLTSSSELGGHGSSKSSISASIDSPSAVGNSLEFNFAAVERHVKSTGTNGSRVDGSGNSPPSMIAFSQGEPLISLKLGKRAYFENVCGGQDAKVSAPSDVTSAATVVKKTKVSQQNAKNWYCQVEGCKVDLSSAKDYNRKHKVCVVHSKAPKVIVAGLERRFCQQCSRFHGIAEFDQNKRSCRRRLAHHNARRRKPQPDTISFNSSRLSTMFYDTSERTNLFFSQPLYGQVRSNAVSSWDNLGGFKFMETKHLPLQPTKTVGLDELHFSTPQISTSVVAHTGHHHNFDGFMPLKGTNTKVLNQGVEASATASNSNNGAPEPGRALSLLSDGSWGSSSSVIQQQPTSHADVLTFLSPKITKSLLLLSAPDELCRDGWADVLTNMHDEAPTTRPAAAPSKLRKVGSEGTLVLAVPKDVEEFRTMSAYGRLKLFTYDELRKATGDFNPGQIVGEGGFGVVYRGVIDGAVRRGYRPTEVAVKVLNPEGLQGDREWLTEVSYLGQYSHPNLVELIGYCCEDDHRLLVYEFMAKGSLEHHLFRRACTLSWTMRVAIALHVARGLAFLHGPDRPIIYRDFKTSNILLDAEFNAKLSDFGLAKEGPMGGETHVSTRVMGTYGYAAPEYIATGHLTVMSDVYGFGVVLLEMLVGRRALEPSRAGAREGSLVDWARPILIRPKKLERILDRRMGDVGPEMGLERVARLAYDCLSQNPKVRPSMARVVTTLEAVLAGAGDAPPPR